MKFLIYLLVIASAMNCGSAKQDETTNPETTKTTPAPVEQQDPEVEIGKLTKDNFLEEPHAAWFNPMYDSYKPEETALEEIKSNINDYEIKIFMGTWCSDSQREVPKFLRLLELSDYDMDRLEINGVTRDKTSPNEYEKSFDIVYVPTIIFLKDGEEVNRFVEYPQQNFEQDIADIVTGRDYKNSYE